MFKTQITCMILHSYLTAETPAKYERDLKYLTYTFDKSKFPV